VIGNVSETTGIPASQSCSVLAPSVWVETVLPCKAFLYGNRSLDLRDLTGDGE